MLTIADGRERLYQWDADVKLSISDKFKSVVDEVHFRAKFSNECLSVKVVRTEIECYVIVPNILLQSNYDIIAYAYCCTSKTTAFIQEFSVVTRPKPVDYVYTETEILRYSDLEERLRTVEGEGITRAVAKYLEENPPEAGATEEEAKQIQANKEAIDKKLDASKLPEAVNAALADAKASGEFDGAPGEPGYTPVKGVDYFDGQPGKDGEPGKDGTPGYTPVKGTDYYTEADKTEMVNAVLSALPTWTGGSY